MTQLNFIKAHLNSVQIELGMVESPNPEEQHNEMEQ